MEEELQQYLQIASTFECLQMQLLQLFMNNAKHFQFASEQNDVLVSPRR